MMRPTLKIALCVSLFCVCFGNAEGSMLESLLSFDGKTDTLRDESLGRFVDVDDSDTVNVGDIFQGVFTIETVVSSGVGSQTVPGTIFGVYSFAISDISGERVTFIAASGSASIGSILTDSGFGPAAIALNDNPGNLNNDLSTAALAIFETSDTTATLFDNLATGGGDLGDFVFDNSIGGAGEEIAGVITPDTGWTLELVLGLTTPDDTHQVELDDEDSPLSWSDLMAPGPLAGEGFGRFEGAYSVIRHNFSTSTVFLPLDNFIFGTPPAIQGDLISTTNTTLSYSDSDALDRGWNVRDDGVYAINVIPEPSSFIVWAGLVGIGLLSLGWKRLKSGAS